MSVCIGMGDHEYMYMCVHIMCMYTKHTGMWEVLHAMCVMLHVIMILF